jgi:hypothetical protein
MAYALKRDGVVLPLTGLVDRQAILEGGRNTIAFEGTGKLRAEVIAAFSTGHSPDGAASSLKNLLCCLPGVRDSVNVGGEGPPLTYENVFRVIIMAFLDHHSMDLRTVRRSCVHIAHPDGQRVIPFDTYNLFYRDELERGPLLALRRRHEGAAT